MKRFRSKLPPILIILIVVLTKGSIGQTSPKSLAIVFRHGDRTPSTREMYPNDPYYNYNFMDGLGQLTHNGKARALGLGESLRQRYDQFLNGIVYSSKTVCARSTDFNRTRTTLQMVLRGLYPSKNTQDLPVTIVPKDEDLTLGPRNCPEFKKMRQEVGDMPEVKEKVEKLGSFMNELQNVTGKKISDLEDVFSLYHILTAESFMGLALPEWAKKDFPEGRLRDAALLTYDVFSYTLQMRRLNGGKLVRELIEKMKSVEAGKTDGRLFLYSAHEDTLVALLKVLKVYKPHVPDYTNAIIFELHETQSIYHIKVYYVNGISRQYSMQQIPQCGDGFCELGKFTNLMKDVFD